MGKSAYFVGGHGDYPKASLFLSVSKGQVYYKGESLKAILEKIKNTEFKECVAMYADTLDAYNLIIYDPDLTLEDARTKAAQQGDEWLASEDGMKLQNMVQWSHPVIRWREIIEHPSFLAIQKKYTEMYLDKSERKIMESRKTEPEIAQRMSFSDAMNRTVADRMSIIKTNMDQRDFDAQRIVPLVRAYLTEEAAAEEIIANMWPYDYKAYPGERNSVVAWVHKYSLSSTPNVLSWLTIKFSNIIVNSPVLPLSTAQSSIVGISKSQSGIVEEAVPFGFFSSAKPNSPDESRLQKISWDKVDFDYLQSLIYESSRKINSKLLYTQKLLTIARLMPERLTTEQIMEFNENMRLLHYLVESNQEKEVEQTYNKNCS